MSMKVSKTAIGAFVLGAIALLVAAVLVFGAGKLFTTEHTYVTFFDGSVKGLNVGSPVSFHGVKVGEVTDISIIADEAAHTLKIMVIFDIEPAKFMGVSAKFQKDPKAIEKAVKELGFRTQLQMQSFVTGQLLVSLDFFPDKPALYVGLSKKHVEIPSVPTPLEELTKTLEDLPFKEIVNNLNETLASVHTLVGSIDARKTTESIEAAIKDVQTLVRNLNAKVDPLVASITRTSGAAEATLNETKETMATARGEIKELATTAKSTLESAQTALKQSEQTLQAYSDDSRTVTEMNKTLRELSATTRSFRNLSDYLERHPESLVRGKPAPKGE
jgi:paraquat-inducible protein B